MRLDGIHGADWEFSGPNGEFKVFHYSGYGSPQGERDEAERFEREHPDWTKVIERF